MIDGEESAASGFGITPAIAEELFGPSGAFITTGNRRRDKKEIFEYMSVPADSHERGRRVLRPANYAVGTPGFGFYEGVLPTGQRYAVLNVKGGSLCPVATTHSVRSTSFWTYRTELGREGNPAGPAWRGHVGKSSSRLVSGWTRHGSAGHAYSHPHGR